MLLPWGHTSVIGHLIEQWQQVGAKQVLIVHAAGDKALEGELERINFPKESRIPNPSPESGMFSSIQCAARWLGLTSELGPWALVLGDQPHLRLETLHALLKLGDSRPDAVCQLSRQGRPRHPVLFPQQIFQQVAHSTHQNLKEFLQSLPSQIVLEESEDPGLDLDIDRPEDYEQALRLTFKEPR
jgi:CTP:molybdopterin cytidylyltransferase MocA